MVDPNPFPNPTTTKKPRHEGGVSVSEQGGFYLAKRSVHLSMHTEWNGRFVMGSLYAQRKSYCLL